MKTKITFMLSIALVFISTFAAYSQNAVFSGEWKLNKEKTVLTDSQLFLSKITIEIKGDSLLTTRVYENGNGEEYPFVENLGLDGKEKQMVVYNMPRTSKASLVPADGSIHLESTTVFTGQNGADSLISKETWKVDNKVGLLTIDFKNKMSAGESAGTNYYNKTK